jgi:hypothetical protein
MACCAHEMPASSRYILRSSATACPNPAVAAITVWWRAGQGKKRSTTQVMIRSAARPVREHDMKAENERALQPPPQHVETHAIRRNAYPNDSRTAGAKDTWSQRFLLRDCLLHALQYRPGLAHTGWTHAVYARAAGIAQRYGPATTVSPRRTAWS